MKRMTTADFPYPYCNLPIDGKPMTLLHVHDAVVPMLNAVRGILETFAIAAGIDELPTKEMGPTFCVLAAQVELAVTIIRQVEA